MSLLKCPNHQIKLMPTELKNVNNWKGNVLTSGLPDCMNKLAKLLSYQSKTVSRHSTLKKLGIAVSNRVLLTMMTIRECGTIEPANQSSANTHGQEENDCESKPNIVLIGDSMVKNINPRKQSKKRVRKFIFPGKRADEIAT